jgi:hypothetical protein
MNIQYIYIYTYIHTYIVYIYIYIYIFIQIFFLILGPGGVEVEEVTWCKPEKLSVEDEWLFRDQTKAGLGCSIC